MPWNVEFPPGLSGGHVRVVALFRNIGVRPWLEDLILLGDCYYLPHEEGAEAVALFERVCALLARNPANWGTKQQPFVGRSPACANSASG